MIKQNSHSLRKGFTTGTCAALAAKAAARLLLSSLTTNNVSILLPGGERIERPLAYQKLLGQTACCAIEKDSGDDPDVTNGIWVYASVSKISQGIEIDGGEGVGRVTKKGLDQPVGNAAINRVPRQMIKNAVFDEMVVWGYTQGLKVIISIPQGEEIAKKTFNPRLGIEGGLSILGSSGIVEPMSEEALFDSICLEIQMKAKNGYDYVALTPGNYGQDFLQDKLQIDMEKAVKVSNFIGGALNEAANAGLAGVLLVGHIGKLIKLAGGITQTHSKYGDCRLELLAAHCALAGADRMTIQGIMDAATTEAALEILEKQGLLKIVMESILKKIEKTVASCLGNNTLWGVAVFSSQYGLLMQSQNTHELADCIREQNLMHKPRI